MPELDPRKVLPQVGQKILGSKGLRIGRVHSHIQTVLGVEVKHQVSMRKQDTNLVIRWIRLNRSGEWVTTQAPDMY